jgi:hypothetical protein
MIFGLSVEIKGDICTWLTSVCSMVDDENTTVNIALDYIMSEDDD